LFQQREKDSKKLGKLFIQITDDFSYARTFYPNRSVRVYLNQLAQNIFHTIFNRRKNKSNTFVEFWKEDLPGILYYHRRELFISFGLLILAIAIGVFTYLHDDSFAKNILGESYLAKTAENIAKDDPMAIYKSMPPVEMFLMIALNNIRVDIITFFSGLIFGIGTALVMLYNGLMLSAFQFYFIKQDLFRESFLAVWLHGTLEISAMVICGAAGLVLGRGFIFPGTYSRMQSFQSSAQRAVKIFFAVLPITFAAAIIESFLTRFTDTPDIIRLLLILASLFFILGYFVYYPWAKHRQGTLRLPKQEKIIPEQFTVFDFEQIYTVPDIIIESFRLMRKNAGIYFRVMVGSVSLILLAGLFLNKAYFSKNIIYTYDLTSNYSYFFTARVESIFSYLLPILIAYISSVTAYIFFKEQGEYYGESRISYWEWIGCNKLNSLQYLALTAVVYYLVIFSDRSNWVIFFTGAVFFLLLFAVYFKPANEKNPAKIFLASLRSEKMSLLAINISFFILIYGFIELFNSSVYQIIYEGITFSLDKDTTDSHVVYLVFFLFSIGIIFTGTIILYSLFQGVFYFSQHERHYATGLQEKLEQIGSRLKKPDTHA
jgi:uncharacterized membrane protein SpoIIM required for sporulation